jgi:hypothetical protein
MSGPVPCIWKTFPNRPPVNARYCGTPGQTAEVKRSAILRKVQERSFLTEWRGGLMQYRHGKQSEHHLRIMPLQSWLHLSVRQSNKTRDGKHDLRTEGSECRLNKTWEQCPATRIIGGHAAFKIQSAPHKHSEQKRCFMQILLLRIDLSLE